MAKVTTVGDRVKLKKDNLLGTVRFVGPIKGKKGVFFGVELDDAKGKNTGTVGKIAYFKCAKKKGLFVKKASILKTNKKNNDAPRVTVDDKVKVKKSKCNGVVKYIGTPDFKPGVWYGIELEKPKGKNNGTVKDRWYFSCKDKCGSFVQAGGLAVLGLGSASESSASKGSSKKKKTKKTTTKKKAEPKKEEKKEEKEDVDYKVGDKIMIKPNRKGQIRWIGEAKEFGAGKYFGIRLTEKRGDCDGEYKDKRCFRCPEGFGVFITLRNIVKRVEFDEDFMNEEAKYEEEDRKKAEELKKERDKLKRLREKFTEVDTDGNLTVDRDEFRKLAADIFGCTKSEANALFKEIDINDSGEISFAEFDNWVEKLGGIEKLDEMTKDDDDEKAKQEEENDDAADDDKGDDAADDNADDNADDGGDNADVDADDNADADADANADDGGDDNADDNADDGGDDNADDNADGGDDNADDGGDDDGGDADDNADGGGDDEAGGDDE